MHYEVKVHREVIKTLSTLSPKDHSRITNALQTLRTNPFRSRAGADILRLKGTKGKQDLFRLRIGDYRAIYAVEGNVVYVTDLFHRGKGYNEVV